MTVPVTASRTKICKERLDLPLSSWQLELTLERRENRFETSLRLEDNMRLITSMTGTISESFSSYPTSMHVALQLLPSLVELPYAMRNENEYETRF